MTDKISIQYHKTEFGELILGSFKNQLCLCDWRYRKMRDSIDSRIKKGLNAEYVQQNSPVIAESIQQISEYIAGDRVSFDISLLLVGTDFQKSVWEELIKIPYGTTQSYLGLAKSMGNEKAIRAIATANGANAISIIIPCHRIIGSSGEMVGYAGGTPTKRKLLSLENRNTSDSQIGMFR
ncbi:MAG: methylated-DNA--[protein]-cysteine S-methyltransferase [Candidatus Kapaibacterium sp.]